MPSPIGHGLAGLLTTWVTAPRARWSLALAGALLAALPDVDVLFGGHRGSTHSLGAIMVVSAAAAAFAAVRRLPIGRVVTVCSLAYASHLLLDWLGKDTATPYGVMVFWPFSSRYYSSGANLFLEISRRYWKPDEFILGNLRSIGWELALLLPIAALAWWIKRQKTEYRRQNTE
jgi:membrane-bound metal-dependent hydrolase YbcI (DUF457 family)